MRRFLVSYWVLPLAILVRAAFSITASIQQEPIKAGLGLGALICACRLTWHTWCKNCILTCPVEGHRSEVNDAKDS